MKRILFLSLIIPATLAVGAQTSAPSKPGNQTIKPLSTANNPGLKNQTDSASYALGMNIAQSLNNDLGDLNTTLVTRGVKDVFSKKKPLFDDSTVYSILSRYAEKMRQQARTDSAAAPVANKNKQSVIKTDADSASYALGTNIAQSLNTDLGDLNTTFIAQGLEDVFNEKPPLFDEPTIFEILSSYSEKIKEQQSQKLIKEGETFLQQNKTKAGVKTTASGLQYEVIKEGTGLKPTAADSVTVHYRGSLLDGTEFDASYDRGEPLTLELDGVIKGWTEGVQLMTVGSKYKFYVPYQLGYGLRGAPPTIPGGSALIFEIELLDVKKTQ